MELPISKLFHRLLKKLYFWRPKEVGRPMGHLCSALPKNRYIKSRILSRPCSMSTCERYVSLHSFSQQPIGGFRTTTSFGIPKTRTRNYFGKHNCTRVNAQPSKSKYVVLALKLCYRNVAMWSKTGIQFEILTL